MTNKSFEERRQNVQKILSRAFGSMPVEAPDPNDFEERREAINKTRRAAGLCEVSDRVENDVASW